MPTSNPRKPKKPSDRKPKASQSTPSAASAFKKGSAKKTVDVTLPSGNTVRVKRISIVQLLTDGLIPDSLGSLVQAQINPKAAAQSPDSDDERDKFVSETMADPKKIADLLGVFDTVAAAVIVEPACEYHMRPVLDEDGDETEELEEIPEDERDEDIVYTDEVDFNDKSFLFQFVVGGTSDLERFREESGAALGNLESL